MEPALEKRISAFLQECSEVFGGTLTKGVLSVWLEALEDWNMETFEGARRALLKEYHGKSMPKPADLIAYKGQGLEKRQTPEPELSAREKQKAEAARERFFIKLRQLT